MGSSRSKRYLVGLPSLSHLAAAECRYVFALDLPTRSLSLSFLSSPDLNPMNSQREEFLSLIKVHFTVLHIFLFIPYVGKARSRERNLTSENLTEKANGGVSP